MKSLLGNHAPASAQDAVLLLARLLLGVVLITHGWQKVVTNGFGGTADGFDMMGIPAPYAAALFAGLVELVGGGLLVLGLLTQVVGVLVALNMAGAFWFAHRGTEVLASEGGWELVAVIGLAGLVLAAVGPGRLSLDHALSGRQQVGEPVLSQETRHPVSA